MTRAQASKYSAGNQNITDVTFNATVPYHKHFTAQLRDRVTLKSITKAIHMILSSVKRLKTIATIPSSRGTVPSEPVSNGELPTVMPTMVTALGETCLQRRHRVKSEDPETGRQPDFLPTTRSKLKWRERELIFGELISE